MSLTADNKHQVNDFISIGSVWDDHNNKLQINGGSLSGKVCEKGWVKSFCPKEFVVVDMGFLV